MSKKISDKNLDNMLVNLFGRDMGKLYFNPEKSYEKNGVKRRFSKVAQSMILFSAEIFKSRKWACGISIVMGAMLIIGTVSMFGNLPPDVNSLPSYHYSTQSSESFESDLPGNITSGPDSSSNDDFQSKPSVDSEIDSSQKDKDPTPTIPPTPSPLISPVPDPKITTNVSIETINKNKALPKFNSFRDILNLLKEMDLYSHMYYRNDIMQDGVVSAPGAPEGTPGASKDFSETNVQVEGIDEGDIIKNDGEYLYISKNNSLAIVKAYPVENIEKTSEIKFSENEYINEIYVKNNKLVIICSSYTQTPLLTRVEADAGVMVDRAWVFYNNTTTISVFDITSKKSPVLIRKISLDGYLISSREKDGNFYIITSKYIVDYAVLEEDEKYVLPFYSDSVSGSREKIIPAKDILYCPEIVSANYLLISTFSINNDDEVKIEAVLGAGSNVYMSHNALYIVQPFYRYYIQNPTGIIPSPEDISSEEIIGENTFKEGTVILKFLLNEKSLKFDSAGEVPGQILNQYSLDEFNNNLRIATTSRSPDWVPSNNLYVLDGKLKIIGKIENLAPTERIYAVRFMGETGYIVTFRDVDPLFVLDLSVPHNPKVTGELKIPGFSNYLHPVSETLLLGIGNHIVDNRTAGVKVSLFDVSNPNIPKEIDFAIFGGAGSSSQAQYYPRAFVWWKTKSMALFPVFLNGKDASPDYSNYQDSKSGAIALTIKDNKILELARLIPQTSEYNYYSQSRVLYIENVVYLSMNNILYAYDADDFSSLSYAAY